MIAKNSNGINAIKILLEIWGGEDNLKCIKDEIIDNIGNISLMSSLSFLIDNAIIIMNDSDKKFLIMKILFNDLKKYLNNKYGCAILYKTVKSVDLFWKIKIKYFLTECLKSEVYNHEEKIKIIDVISQIQ